MKFIPEVSALLERYKNYVFVVEGKKDVNALHALGFERVYAIHAGGLSLRERIERIALIAGRKEKLCILTDFDKKGKELYFILKREFQALGVRLDSTLRGILLRAGVSHIEGLDSYMQRFIES